MTDDEFRKQVRSVANSIIAIARRDDMSPVEFQTFMGAVTTNIVGNMTDEYWSAFSRVSKCDQPGCDCQALSKKIVAAWTEQRREFKACVKGGFPA